MNVSFELVSGIILVKVNVNGKNGYMAFDTGAMQTCLHKAHFTALEGEEKEVSKFAEGLVSDTTKSSKATIICGEWNIREKDILVLDMNYVEKPLQSLKPDVVFLGTLGIDCLKEHSICLDYEHHEIILDEPMPNDLKVYDMNIDILPVIDVVLDETSYKFVLDTGANTCLLDEAFKDKEYPNVNGSEKIVEIPKLKALGNEYTNIMAVLSDISAIKKKLDVSGVIGYQLLNKHKTYFDFAGKVIVLDNRKSLLPVLFLLVLLESKLNSGKKDISCYNLE